MDFGGAIHTMIGGSKVRRIAWAREVWLCLQKPDDHSKMTRPYFYKQEGEANCVPWIPTFDDMLADDWEMQP